MLGHECCNASLVARRLRSIHCHPRVVWDQSPGADEGECPVMVDVAVLRRTAKPRCPAERAPITAPVHSSAGFFHAAPSSSPFPPRVPAGGPLPRARPSDLLLSDRGRRDRGHAQRWASLSPSGLSGTSGATWRAERSPARIASCWMGWGWCQTLASVELMRDVVARVGGHGSCRGSSTPSETRLQPQDHLGGFHGQLSHPP